MGWYQFATRFVTNKQVLDVGCGLGDGLRVLARYAARVQGQDLDDRLAASNIVIGELGTIEDNSYDIVTAIDVIEHVAAPIDFLKDCFRIAREGVFLSTPNWTASRCKWPYHLREYTPAQFAALLEQFGAVTLFKGNCCGCEVYPVKYPPLYFVLNYFRNNAVTAFPTRCINHVLPKSCKIGSSNAAWIWLK